MDCSEDQLIPRDYQHQLEEVAVCKNTIIYLPTGSGKTLIAIRLIKRLRKTLQKPWGEGGKRCFFLVNTVPLVIQQKKVIEQLCPVSGVGGFSSEDNIDFWDKAKWDTELSKHQVIVMTCQILADMLTHQYIRLNDISLLVFDECHHGVEDHPMRLIMKHFQNCPKHQQPRVLGLTATLLNSSVKFHKVPETLRDLETTFQATIATADSIGQVAMFSTNPKELVIYYGQPQTSVAAAEATRLLLELNKIVYKFELPNNVKIHNLKLKAGQHDISTDPNKVAQLYKELYKEVARIGERLITEFIVKNLDAENPVQNYYSDDSDSQLYKELYKEVARIGERLITEFIVKNLDAENPVQNYYSDDSDSQLYKEVARIGERLITEFIVKNLDAENPVQNYYSDDSDSQLYKELYKEVARIGERLITEFIVKNLDAENPVQNYYSDDSDSQLYKELYKEVARIGERLITEFIVKNLDAENPVQNYYSDDSIVKAVAKIVGSMVETLREMGVFGGALGILANIVALERRRRWAVSEPEELLYSVAITHANEARAVLLESMKKHTGYEKIIRHSAEKIIQFLNILKEYNPEYISSDEVSMSVNKERNELSAIIITQQRFTSKLLYNLLKEVIEANPKEFGFLKHDFIVGFNVSPNNITREQYYNKKMSEQRLLQFKNGELNCLVSTAVVEEGVDVPQCALVLRYDAPLEYRSYVQSKGRARSKTASFVILVEKANKMKFQSRYSEYRKVEQYLQSMLYGETDRNCPSEDVVDKNLYKDEEVAPYVTQNGVFLPATSAVSLVSRYCGQLPHDRFTTLMPGVLQEQTGPRDSRYIVTFIMPIACPVKGPIRGLPYNSTRSAKRSAALNTCIKLHEAGELDDETLLPKPRGKIDFEDVDVKACFPNWCEEPTNDDDVPRPGTKKRVRKHPIYYPHCLRGAPRVSGWLFHLHVVVSQPACAPPVEPREAALHALLQAPPAYGLLSAHKLPSLPAFPVFLGVGELRTHLDVNYKTLSLQEEQFELVKRFHFFIFDQVLAVAKRFLVFNGEVNNLFVVPLKEHNGFQIDWYVMQTYREIRPCTEPTFQERTSQLVTKETYNNCVVTPWYRGTLHPDRYIVSNVLEYLTPYSKFDGDSFETYADYYANKYNLEIMGDRNQPLLEVINISTRMNCLLPRAATIHAFTDKQRRLASQAQGDDKPRAFNELFVPEYCVKYDFPGALWYRASMLPSVLHRVTMLLVADELRVQIATETNMGRPHLVKGESWLPIEVDLAVAKKSLLSNLEEPPPIHSIDRINNPTDDGVQKTLNIMSLKESVYQIQKKKVSKMYPWDESSEPTDIERNLSHINITDIECYDKFMMMPMFSRESPPRLSLVRSPPRASAAAILPPPLQYDACIELLQLGQASPPPGAPEGPQPRAPEGPQPRAPEGPQPRAPEGPQPRAPAGPQPRALLAALTTVGSHDTCDLERAETLGDSFLKYAASLYLFHKFPGLDEGRLTNIKGRLIGNRNLMYAGLARGLGGRMKVEQFSPRSDFLLPAFLAPPALADFITRRRIRPTFLIGLQFSTEEALSGELSPDTRATLRDRMADADLAEEEPEGKAQNAMQRYVQMQAVSDKSVADCVEALIGTYLLNGGIPDAIKVMEWLKIIPPQDNFITYLHKKVSTVITEGKATEEEVEFLLNHCRSDIEDIIGYKFNDPSLLLEALSHGSYIRNNYTRSYERLEFLGDAILDFLITAHIFEKCGKLSPGDLTDLRSALVNNVTFASYVVKLGLHKFLFSQFNGSLDNAIKNFVEHQEQREHDVSEEVLYLIDEQDCCIAQYIDVPKVLSDIFESVTGAIYLDCGGDLERVWAVIYKIMHKEISTFSMCVPKQPVRVLMERIHACPSFGKCKECPSTESSVLCPVSFSRGGQRQTVYGVGANKAAAKRAAAKLALKILAA